ncbi:hypothetical protein M885DRAFT_144474 [Pelagophyceae sp. CCMP2097]|nr:hypothetical protein M885DRAFT_144474 [Pelagophyceae sp. CCMP2097]
MSSFWGGSVSAAAPLVYEPDFSELTLARAVVVSGKAGGRCTLYIQADDGKRFALCTLSTDCGSAKLDMQCGTGNEEITFSVEGGDATVHLTGYVNPPAEYEMDSDEEADDEEEIDDDGEVVDEKVLAVSKFGIARMATDEDDEDDDDFEEGDEDEDELDGAEERAASKALYANDSDDEDSDEDEFGVQSLIETQAKVKKAKSPKAKAEVKKSPAPAVKSPAVKSPAPTTLKPPAAKSPAVKSPAPTTLKSPAAKSPVVKGEAKSPAVKSPAAAKSPAAKSPAADAGKTKRKLEENSPVAAKKVKTEEGDSAGWKTSIVDYLKTNGTSALSALGNHCKKPTGVQTKLKAFLASHPDTFNFDGPNVALK